MRGILIIFTKLLQLFYGFLANGVKMGKVRFILIFLWVFVGCNKPETEVYKKIYYFYDEKKVLGRGENESRIGYDVKKTAIVTRENIGTPPVVYYLSHCRGKDTTFVKPKSYLKKIDYLNSEWLSSESNRNYFWEKLKRGHEETDTLKIYMIEKNRAGDSLKFIRVNRFILWPD